MWRFINCRVFVILYGILYLYHQVPVTTGDVFGNGTIDILSEALLNPDLQGNVTELDEDGSRIKRNHLTNSLQGQGQAGSSVPGNGVEGLLASCQLTNLLLYQILQQRNSLGLAGSPAGGTGTFDMVPNNFQPFPAAGGIVNNFLLPPRLTTYVTTSSFVTQLTTTAVITIPLLFGNKPSPTTITRTKTYEVSTYEVHTITTTIESSTSKITPSPSTILPVATSTNSFLNRHPSPTPTLEEVDTDPENDVGNSKHQPSQYTTPVLNHDNSVAKKIKEMAEKYSFQKRTINRPIPLSNFASRNVEKILRSNPATTENYKKMPNLRTEYTDKTPVYQYNAEQYSKKRLDQSPREIYYDTPPIRSQEERPYAYQDDDEVDDNYYARRLKRLGEAVDTRSRNDDQLEREYLLEPSFDGPSSNEFQPGDLPQCPPPIEITVTVTKTITKFLNPPQPTPVSSTSTPTPTPTTTPTTTQRQWKSESTTEKRARGGRRFQVSLKAQASSSNQQIRPSSSSIPNVELSSTTSTPRTRKRGRGDILHRERSSLPSTPFAESTSENIRLQEIGGSYGDVAPERLRQRNARKRRPQTQ